jgi:VWFA-related protein
VIARRAPLVVAWAVALAALAAARQEPTFRARVEAVRVDVLVAAGGRPVAGLRPEDFEVRDNGILQRVDVVDPLELPLNLVFVFDLSESVAGEPLSHLKAASRAVLEGLRPDDRVALVGFTDAVRLECPLTEAHERVNDALSRVVPTGNTSWTDAAFGGLMVAESEAGRSLALVFTDGLDTASWLSADSLSAIARRTGVVVYGVSAGAARRPVELGALADGTGGRLIAVDSTKTLRGTFLQILDEFRHRYLIAFTPQGPRSPGWHTLEVRLESRRATITARPGYWVEQR